MILDFDTWIYGKLTAAVGSVRVDYWYPNSFVKLPATAYRTTQKNSDMDYQDDFAQYSDCTVEIDIYSQAGYDDFALSKLIADMFATIYFNLDMSEPIPNPDEKVNHRHMSFSRQGVGASDLI